MALPYQPDDKESILAFAKRLKNKTLQQACEEVRPGRYTGKGGFGQMLEKYYFGYEPNSKAEADFALVDMELKSSPMKQLTNGEYRAKERLVLSIINYEDVAKEQFDSSTYRKKNTSLLLVFYLHVAGKDIRDLEVKLVGEWQVPATDLEIIRKDWETIRQKIIDGKAHELSEGDTFYLGACTKGADAKTLRKQPYSDIPAKQRAYSLKQGYVNHIIATIANAEGEKYGKLLPSLAIARKKSIEEIVTERFKRYYGRSVEEIVEMTGAKLNKTAKGFYAQLTKAMLGTELNQEIEEFEKAEIIVKTSRLSVDELPREAVSFPTFKYTEIVDEEWEDSPLREMLEHKFLWVFYQYNGDVLILKKVKFWNMPFADIEETKRVWAATKTLVGAGTIIREVTGATRSTNFPNTHFSKVAHVRPHAANAADTYPLPVADIVTGANTYTKHCFWLNREYVRDNIYRK